MMVSLRLISLVIFSYTVIMGRLPLCFRFSVLVPLILLCIHYKIHVLIGVCFHLFVGHQGYDLHWDEAVWQSFGFTTQCTRNFFWSH